MGMHPSSLCPFCEETDTPLHFLCCQQLNAHNLFIAELHAFQSRASKAAIPDHIINTISDLIQGLNKSTNRQPPTRRNPYLQRTKIGWSNFTKGRLSKSWISQKPATANSTDDASWMATLNKTILGALLMKWEIHCKIAAEPQTT